MHQIDHGIDTGPVIFTARPYADRTRSLFWHLPQLYQPGVDLFLKELTGLAEGRRPAHQPQDRAQRCYHSTPTARETSAFQQMGFPFLHESDYAEVVHRFRVKGPH
ncbi:hypothetical protein ACFWXA_34790 [Streptomyces atroolivaceus]|uniref:hypothetical protein n=1 Tax=Streptomyces atroolivaceus TaxID=66869 RepID=UPI0036583F44